MRVIELGTYLAVPYAGARLRDLGASVFKYGPDPYAERYPEGAARLLEGKAWIKDREPTSIEYFTADVVLTNRSQDNVLVLAARWPRLIVAKVTNIHHGPVLDAMVQARHGLFLPGDPPRPNPVFLVDQRVGLMLVEQVLWKSAHGQGGIILVTPDEAAAEILRPTGGRLEVPDAATYRAYRCRDDRYLMLCVGWDRHWARFVEALDLPWADKYPTALERRTNRAEIVGRLDGIFGARAAATWRDHLRSYGVPCEVVAHV